MELYNHLINDTRDMLKGSPKVWDYSESAKWKDLGSSELVLQKDAAYELGAQGHGSANYVLFTSSSELVSEDKVMLFGRDMGEIKSDCDFARIVLLRIGVMDDDDEKVYCMLKDIEFVKAVELGYVETIGSPEYSCYLNDYMAILQAMLT